MNPFVEKYVASHAEYDRCWDALSNQIREKEDKIERLTNQIAKLKKKQESIPSPMPWMDVLDGYKDELEAMSGLTLKHYGPHGLRAEVSLCLVDESKKDKMGWGEWVYYLTITPDIRYSEGSKIVDLKFRYDTGEVDRSFPEGSIGALNNCGNRTAELPDDAAAIYELMKAYTNREEAR